MQTFLLKLWSLGFSFKRGFGVFVVVVALGGGSGGVRALPFFFSDPKFISLHLSAIQGYHRLK